MNIPKRASCHHFMRRSRSASCGVAASCEGLSEGSVPAMFEAIAFGEASVISDAVVPARKLRRARIGGFIRFSSPVLQVCRVIERKAAARSPHFKFTYQA